ncbi:MAG: DF family (seleno)protein [Solirubrobacterales bacterium]
MSESQPPLVEFLWWRECPSWERVLARLRATMEELGLDPDSIEQEEMLTEDDAERSSFIGSPTIRVDGVDVQPPGPDQPAGLSCRIYRHRDGKISPLPDPDDVRDALRKAMEQKETVS